MGSKSSKPTTTYVNNTVNPQMLANYNQITGAARNLAAQPYRPYSGQLVAGITDTQQAAIGRLGEIQGIADPYFQKGASWADKAANTDLTPMQFSQSALDQYMNPYQAEVIKATMANIAENNAQQRQGLIGNAIAKGAWGGDRAGIAQAAMARQQDLASNATFAQLNSDNYKQALDMWKSQQAIDLQSRLGMANLGLGAGQLYTSLGTGISNANIQQALAQLQAGTVEQQTEQNALNAAYGQWLDRRNFPYQQLGWLSNIYYGFPSGADMGRTTQQYSPAPSLGSQIVGGLTAGIGLLSDENAKENLKGIGRLNDGQKIYSYNYKNDPTPRIGLLAGEVEKHHPEAVSRRPDGLRQVNYALATAAAAAKDTGIARARRAFGGGLDAGDLSDTSGLGASGMVAASAPGITAPLDALERARAAITGVESGGRYDVLGPQTRHGRAIGRYQVMPDNVGPWTEQYYGQRLSPDEFRANHQAQDAVFNGRYGEYLSKYGPEGAASMWHSGRPTPGNSTDGYMSTADYVKRVTGGGSGIAGAGGSDTLAGGDGLAASAPNSKFGGYGYFDKPGLLTGSSLDGNARLALIAAGGAMMASRSPYMGNAIGEGIQAGAGQYEKGLDRARENALAQSQIDYHKGELGFQNRRLDTVEAPEAKQRIAEGQQRMQTERWIVKPGLQGWTVMDATNPAAGAKTVPYGTAALPDGTPLPPAPASSPGAGGGAGGAQPSAPSAPQPDHYDPITGQSRPGMDPNLGQPTPPPNQVAGGAKPGTASDAPQPGVGGQPQFAADEADGAPPLPKDQPWLRNPQGYNPAAMPGVLEDGRQRMAAAQASSEKAQQSLLMLKQMREAASVMNSSRWTQGGANNEWRASVLQQFNGAYRFLYGREPPTANVEAALEDMRKGNFRLGMTALNSLANQREPGFMQQAGIGAVPGPQTSALGQARLFASLEAQQQREIDFERYLQKYNQASGGDLTQAQTEFNKVRPPAYYARQALFGYVPPQAIADLQKDPTLRRQFDAHYGAGASSLVLGGQ